MLAAKAAALSHVLNDMEAPLLSGGEWLLL
jgi:hypothetical protein